MLWHSMPRSSGHGKGRLVWPRLADYALCYRCQSLTQRLGYLIDLLSLPIDAEARERLLRGTGKTTCYLGQPGRWGRGGEYNATWRMVDNVPRQALLGDIEGR